jgi:DNA-binding transcriptional ArsR family regulator
MSQREGAILPAPNYTQAPNLFFDKLLAEIDSLAELKVTLAIRRQTFGFHKKESELSATRLEQITGLSRRAVFDGLKLALERGHITRRERGQSFLYSLNIQDEIQAELVQDLHQCTIETSAESAPELVQDLHQQLVQTLHPIKETRKRNKKENKSTAPSGAGETRLPDDFSVTPEMAQWAAEKTPLVDVAAETEAFCDYWRGVPGLRGKKLDWPATWRNRMRDRQDYRARNHKLGKKESDYESASERNVRLIRESLGDETNNHQVAPRKLSSGPNAGGTGLGGSGMAGNR